MGILPEGLNIGGIGGGLGGAMQMFTYIIIGIITFIFVGGIVGIIIWKRKQKHKYNIPLIIITPRSDGRVVEINTGLGGFFKSKNVGGIASFRIKRKGIGVVEIPPPASSFLSSPNRTLLLAQKGVDDYEPIMPESLSNVFTGEYETDKDGKQIEDKDGNSIPLLVPILNLRAINQDATAWHCDNLETAKKRFTLYSLWEKYQVLISLMTFILILFIIMYINWIGMKDVVAGLKEVADGLRGTAAPIITPGG